MKHAKKIQYLYSEYSSGTKSQTHIDIEIIAPKINMLIDDKASILETCEDCRQLKKYIAQYKEKVGINTLYATQILWYFVLV